MNVGMLVVVIPMDLLVLVPIFISEIASYVYLPDG